MAGSPAIRMGTSAKSHVKNPFPSEIKQLRDIRLVYDKELGPV